MRKFFSQNPFALCIGLMTLVFLPFFTSLLYPDLPAEGLFENSYFGPVFAFLFSPGLLASMIFLAPITALFHWSESSDLLVLFFSGGMISVVFWSLILFRIYKRFFENQPVAPVVKVPAKKPAARKKK